jgi:hypothetical protein
MEAQVRVGDSTSGTPWDAQRPGGPVERSSSQRPTPYRGGRGTRYGLGLILSSQAFPSVPGSEGPGEGIRDSLRCYRCGRDVAALVPAECVGCRAQAPREGVSLTAVSSRERPAQVSLRARIPGGFPRKETWNGR